MLIMTLVGHTPDGERLELTVSIHLIGDGRYFRFELITDVTTVCTASRLDVMSLPVDCVFQARYHETLA